MITILVFLIQSLVSLYRFDRIILELITRCFRSFLSFVFFFEKKNPKTFNEFEQLFHYFNLTCLAHSRLWWQIFSSSSSPPLTSMRFVWHRNWPFIFLQISTSHCFLCACVLLLFFVLCDIFVLFLACCTNVSCSLFLFSTNLGSDRSCQQQQQHHTADEKTTAWRRYCYYRCLPAAGIAHTLVLSKIYLFFSLLCLLFFNTHTDSMTFDKRKSEKDFEKVEENERGERRKLIEPQRTRTNCALMLAYLTSLLWFISASCGLVSFMHSTKSSSSSSFTSLFLLISTHQYTHKHIHSDRFIFLPTKTRKKTKGMIFLTKQKKNE